MGRETCQYPITGYYQQLFFKYDGNPIILNYLGNKAMDLTLQWWLDYSMEESFCEEPYVSATQLTNFRKSVDSLFLAYTDLGPINTVSSFETANQLLKASDYPNWMHNLIMVQIEPMDGQPLNGYVYVGGETLKIMGYSATVPLSKRSFLPAAFQVSFPIKRKFRVRWWAEYRTPQDVPVQMHETRDGNGDSIFCEYEFTVAKRKKLTLKYSSNDFADGLPPRYTARSLLEGVALSQAESALRVGTIYDIQAKPVPGKKITLAIPLETNGKIESRNVAIFHEHGGAIKEIPIDSIANGFIYFKTDSFSSFWGKIIEPIGDMLVGVHTTPWGVATVVGWVSEGTQYMNDKLEDFFRWVENGVCNLFDPQTWKNLFSSDLDGSMTDDYSLYEGRMPVKENLSYIPYQRDLINSMVHKPLTQINDNMVDTARLHKTSDNLDIMLFELISRKMGYASASRFSVNNLANLVDNGNPQYVKNYMALSTKLTKYAIEMTEMVEACYGALNSNTLSNFLSESKKLFSGHSSGEQVCKDLFESFGVTEHSFNVANCTTDGIKMLTQYINDGSTISAFIKERDDLVLATTEVLARVALLAYYDKPMRESLKTWFNQTYKSLSAMMELMGPLMLYNNMAIKAEAAMALYEYVYWGTTTHFERFKTGIEIHYGENGGFSEGMGYLQYVNEDVPYLMVALKKAFWQNGQIIDLPDKFYKSAYYLKKMSRNIRWSGRYNTFGSNILVPMETDDGRTYTPDFSVWGTLTGDDSFFKLARNYPIDAVKAGNPISDSPLLVLGLPDHGVDLENDNSNNSNPLSGAFMDGAAIINYHEGGDNYTITLVGESGDLWANGQAHDQQDNVSFTLSSTRDGHIVRDLGYSGFGDDSKTRGYKNHNVLMRPEYSDWTDGSGNKSLTYQDLSNRAKKYSHENTGYGTQGMFLLSSNVLAKYEVVGAGGSEASLADSAKGDNFLGYTVYQKTLGRVFKDPLSNEWISVDPFENYRSIAYFGKTLWLFDQPSDDNLLWVVNGSTETAEIQGSYFDEKVDLYIGDYKVNRLDGWEQIGVQQNAGRADYSAGNMVIANRQYVNLPAWRDASLNNPATPITMVYPIDTIKAFRMVSLPGVVNVQCFERIDGNVKQRVVVPAKGVSYRIRDVLPNIPPSDYSSYNGIMFAKKIGDGAWEINLLNDGSKVNKNFVKTKYLPSLMLLRGR